MFSLVHRALLFFSPESAHEIGACLIKFYQRLLLLILKPKFNHALAVRTPEQGRLKFSTPLGLAAGFDKNADLFMGLSRLGFGFIEVGTVTPKSQEGNPKPRLWRVEPAGLINQMGFNNCGVSAFKKNLQRLRPYCPVPILANVGKNRATPNELAVEDYRILFSELVSEVDGFVVNISSPNTEGLRDLQTIEFLEQIESIAPAKPIWVKFAPDLNSDILMELFQKIKESQKFSGCVLTNTSRKIAETEYSFQKGGYSGEKLFERSLECVSLCRQVFKEKKSIIAVGGINSVVRAKKMIAEGANLVEVYTAFVYQGPNLVRDISKELADESFELRF